jgi:hypothetical protein
MPKRKRHTVENQQTTEERFRQIKRNSEKLILPHLVAIYRGSRDDPEQIATGFLVRCRSCSVLVTAKHSLYGEGGEVDALTNMVFVNGELKFIGELKSHRLITDPDNDLVVFCVDEFPVDQAFPVESFCQNPKVSAMVTILGFLARDFKRSGTALHPAPYVFTNKASDRGPGYVGLLHPKSLNRNTESGIRVMVPRPSGLSGCPMINPIKLLKEQVCIVGVFTDQANGIAFGEASPKLYALLSKLCR